MPSSLIKGFSDFRPQLRPLPQTKAGALSSPAAVKKVEALPSTPAAQTSAPWYKDPKAQKAIAAVGSLIAACAAYRYFSATNQQDPPPPPSSNQCTYDLNDPDLQAHLSQVSQATSEPASKVSAEIYLADLAGKKPIVDLSPVSTMPTLETFAEEESLRTSKAASAIFGEFYSAQQAANNPKPNPKPPVQPNPPPAPNGANGAGNPGGKPKAAPIIDTQRLREEFAKGSANLHQFRQRNNQYRTS